MIIIYKIYNKRRIMKISKLIDELVKVKENNGDIVVACCDSEGYLREADKLDVWASSMPFDSVKSGDLYLKMYASNNPISE